jgi:hypothetical protein
MVNNSLIITNVYDIFYTYELFRRNKMNLKLDLSKSNQELLEQAGIEISNKNYSPEEIKKCENNIASYIMSKSLKNMDVSNESIRYSDLMEFLIKNEN